MARNDELPDIDGVLAGLKDFQRNTVEYVFRRMYTDPDRTRRFLVADEVGLGKTLIARGIVAKVLEHLWDRVGRIDIVYICSNSDIARQNINRLNITGVPDVSLASRITILPVTLKELTRNRINFVSFTPATSFDLKGSMGRKEERALLFHLLAHAWGDPGATGRNVLRGTVDRDRFEELIARFRDRCEIDEGLVRDFERALEMSIKRDRERGETDVHAEFNELRQRFHRHDAQITEQDRIRRNHLVGRLRLLLAETCLRALEPDLIILDEFQRFKHLLDDEADDSLLARELFEYADETTEARVLLLSATPYKMYTLSEEADKDSHYRDFLRTVEFLLQDRERTGELEEALERYRIAMYALPDGNPQELEGIKDRIEAILSKVMSRTERLAASTDRNGMLAETKPAGLELNLGDVQDYLAHQALASAMGEPDVIEYWKSAPYLLNFMDHYSYKTRFVQMLGEDGAHTRLGRLLEGSPAVLLPWRALENYAPIDPRNVRLRAMLAETVDKGVWRLLWIAPSLPYYQLGGPFRDPVSRQFTKRLVFSTWKVVPRAVATLVGYEAERRAMKGLDPEARNTPEERERRRSTALLRFGRAADGRLRGMPVLALVYPSITLAEVGDPLRWATGVSDPAKGQFVDVADVRAEVAKRFRERLSSLEALQRQSHPDESWYWAAPLLLDMQDRAGAMDEWFSQEDLAAAWAGVDEDKESGVWADHVAEARAVAQGRVELGTMPDDLPEVLADLALGGPGTVALRALARITGGTDALEVIQIRNAAGRVAFAFQALFNRPETTAVVRAIHKEGPYWRRVLEYCIDGCLQAVLDEYAHCLLESLGLMGKPAAEVAASVSETMCRAITILPAQPGVDRIELDTAGKRISRITQRLGSRFALPFETDLEGVEGRSRTEAVREAFNSPFWPFVLVSTSVGQEGLDFHTYCHAVVHWNLPANPVDMEQREGRVHRYKGHAVRKNLALRHGSEVLAQAHRDPWVALFERARLERDPDQNDLVPYWIYPVEGGARIERHVPALPLSRDSARLQDLRRSLAVYRMVFGQPRQEDLLRSLLQHLPNDEVEQWLSRLRIDLAPRLGPEAS